MLIWRHYKRVLRENPGEVRYVSEDASIQMQPPAFRPV